MLREFGYPPPDPPVDSPSEPALPPFPPFPPETPLVAYVSPVMMSVYPDPEDDPELDETLPNVVFPPAEPLDCPPLPHWYEIFCPGVTEIVFR